MAILIKNIKALVQAENNPKQILRGKEMQTIPIIEDSFLLIENDKIVDFGEMKNFSQKPETRNQKLVEIDATGKFVLPCWCDSHTHIVYAGSRENEFVDRIKGLTYEQIAQKGGGILNSAKKLNQTSEEELLQSALARLQSIMRMGTGAVEIKSGYGLTVEGELKMLRVIQQLKKLSPLTIKSTFLGAHAIPTEYKNDRDGYIKLLIEKMLPKIAEEKLADYIDVFCETNYFTPKETEQILGAGAKYGLKPKIHVNQFSAIGGVGVGVKHNALSVDHLEIVSDEDIKLLSVSRDGIPTYTMPTLLPACSFFINIPYSPARKMMDAGLPVALATDYNPGSSPSGNMNFVISLACIQMKMTPEEAINAATINGAYAMELNGELGSIARGKKANVFITKEIPSIAYLPYSFGENLMETVIINGEIQ